MQPDRYHPDIDNVTRLLNPEDIRDLTTPSDLQGWISVATTWTIITSAFALVGWQTTWWSITIALILLGGRQLALAILMHDCAHYALFRTKRLNDTVGTWLCAAPAWSDVTRYRKHHLTHHAHTGTEKDNDLCLVEPFPTSFSGLLRKFARDLTGLTGIKRMLGLLLMDFGFLTYSASGGQRWVDPSDRSILEILRTGLRNTGPTIVTNALLFAVLWLSGHPWLYGLWVIAYLTTFSLFLRIRAIAEHACTTETANQFLNTRTIGAGWLARLTVAPHHVNYHLEHHLLMTVPHYKLKELHRRLRERGVYEHAHYAPNYIDVLRTVIQPGIAASGA